MKLVKLNQTTIIDAIIAYLAVTIAPELLNRFLFSANPVTGTSLKLMGAGAGYVAGSLMNKPNVSNIAVALAAVDLLKPVIDNFTGGLNQAIAPAPVTNQIAKNSVADFMRLEEYVNTNEAAALSPAEVYQNFYN